MSEDIKVGDVPFDLKKVNGRGSLRTLLLKTLLPLFVGVILALIPTPSGLAPKAWYFFSLFSAVVMGLVMEPIPATAVGFLGVSAAAALGMVEANLGKSIVWALSGFFKPTLWLIFATFMFAVGYAKTGLGRRIGLSMVMVLGSRTLGLGYAITLTDLILAPFTPSNTARSGGTIYPVIQYIPALFDSEPGPTARRIGSYLMWTACAITTVTSSMFVTAMAPNLLGVEIVKKTVGVEITWIRWCVGFLPAGVILVLALPALVYSIYPPELKFSPDVPRYAKEELVKMGRMSSKEKLMAGLALFALVLWIFGQSFIDPATVALSVVGLMILTGIIDWTDIMGNRTAWSMLAWFATLVALADGLGIVGFTAWVGKGSATLLSGISPTFILVFMVAVYFICHYMFASTTAHTTAMLPVFLSAGAAVPGMNVPVLSIMLLHSLGMMGVLTPYATGHSPVYFSSGYIERKDFWKLGLIFGLIFLAVFLIVNTPYLLFTSQ